MPRKLPVPYSWALHHVMNREDPIESTGAKIQICHCELQQPQRLPWKSSRSLAFVSGYPGQFRCFSVSRSPPRLFPVPPPALPTTVPSNTSPTPVQTERTTYEGGKNSSTSPTAPRSPGGGLSRITMNSDKHT